MKPLYIKEVEGKGRGVFSAEPIRADETIEVCYMLVMPPEDYPLLTATFFVDYCFFYNREENRLGLATGFGSLYNHAVPSNAIHAVNKEDKTVIITAVRDIAAHEEICINYTGSSNDDSMNWFASRNIQYQS